VAPQRALVPYDDVVEALTAQRADHAFDERVGQRQQLRLMRTIRHEPFV